MGFVNLPATVNDNEDPLQVINQILLYLSAAPTLSAVVSFDGTPAVPVWAYGQNVSPTIAKLGAGNYRVTFTSPYVGVRYLALASAGQLFARTYNRTETTVDVLVSTLLGVATDSTECQLVVIDIPA